MTQTIVLDQYALTAAAPEAVWAVVGNPRRLPEWTDADEVTDVDPEPTAAGGRFVTRDGRRHLEWSVNSFEPFLFEAVTVVARGRLGIGARVVAHGAGARLVLAGAFRPDSTRARLDFQLSGARGLRRRFDRWSKDALRIARS